MYVLGIMTLYYRRSLLHSWTTSPTTFRCLLTIYFLLSLKCESLWNWILHDYLVTPYKLKDPGYKPIWSYTNQESHLAKLTLNITTQPLYSILCNLWQLSLDCVHNCLKEVQLKKGSNSAPLHQRSFTMLSALKDFYHSEGDGIREENLKTDTYNVRCFAACPESIIRSQLSMINVYTWEC